MFRVLYVDDEPGPLEIGKLFLEKEGRFSVDVITSASGALSLMESATYDAIIADYQMPGMDGIEFLKHVRSSGNSIPFILFTGRGREEIVIQALNSGADFYLQKEGEPRSQFTELLSKIRKAASRWQAEKRVVDLNRVTSLLSQVNKCIVRICNSDELFKAICTVAVEHGKFKIAWIGIADRRRPANFVCLEVSPAFNRIMGTKMVIGNPVTAVFLGIKNTCPKLFEIYGGVSLTGMPARTSSRCPLRKNELPGRTPYSSGMPARKTGKVSPL
ncbi:MAG: response regulator [Methanoregula sp.]|uniref:response regulator n=1 Tax=Methanoregula sp. TaxID=2052170 RepID=UPI003BAFC666